jgi:hypothetical protein
LRCPTRPAVPPLRHAADVIAILKIVEADTSSPAGAKLYELKVVGLEGRFFGGVTKETSNDCDGDDGSTISSRSDDEPPSSHRRRVGGGGQQLQTTVGEGMMFKEDTFLTSANLCRWIINYGEIQVGKQIGLGSYGVVYRGKWKGVEVAVKRFIKQKLDERRMLEFRAEMAFLSELHHPNIVLFIGTQLTVCACACAVRHSPHTTLTAQRHSPNTTHDTTCEQGRA